MSALEKTFDHGLAPARPSFAFQSRRGILRGDSGAMLPRGAITTLSERLAAFFAAAGSDALISGALPFDRGGLDCLRAASSVVRTPRATPPGVWPQMQWRVRAEPSAATYAASVQQALDIMAREKSLPDGLEKIVLSRSLLATADQAIDLDTLLERLAIDPAVTVFRVNLPEQDGAPRTLIGATPELLVAKTGKRISSHPLAGSARRQADLAADASAAAELGRSEKDRGEHDIVVEFILDTLSPHCRTLLRPEGTAIISTNSMWHLGTRIEGELKDPDMPVALLAAALHPTPAVCGLPREHSAKLITDLEAYDRDFYAGTVGWCDGRGDGAWYVTIRCAEICEATARLYAGAGIVPQSDPAAEAAETGAKFGALLAALGIDLPLEKRG